jgi:hypothetical protein
MKHLLMGLMIATVGLAMSETNTATVVRSSKPDNRVTGSVGNPTRPASLEVTAGAPFGGAGRPQSGSTEPARKAESR